MRISDWSSDVCSSDLRVHGRHQAEAVGRGDPPEAGDAHLALAHDGDEDVERLLGDAVDLLDVEQRPLTNGGEQRSEENTSELQSIMSISYAVFCLKKKN